MFMFVGIRETSQSPSEAWRRENQTRLGNSADIDRRLAKAFQLAEAQRILMSFERKSFKYVEAPLHAACEVQETQIRNYPVIICQAQGERKSMEDECLVSSFDLEISGTLFPATLVGVFDGHGGVGVTQYVKAHLQEYLIASLKEFNKEALSTEGIWNALKMGCVKLNKKIPGALYYQGSTATFTLILDGKLWVANIGDSRTVLDQGGKFVALTRDAKPNDSVFLAGIHHRGGYVAVSAFESGSRVNGQVSIARTFGNHYMAGVMSARPKISGIPCSDIPRGSHLVLGSDGIWNRAKTEQILHAVRTHAGEGLDNVARNIVFSCGANSGDNKTLMILKL